MANKISLILLLSKCKHKCTPNLIIIKIEHQKLESILLAGDYFVFHVAFAPNAVHIFPCRASLNKIIMLPPFDTTL